MDNQLWGSITILFSATCCLLSWRYYKKDNYTPAIILLMASGFALRFFTSLDFFLHPWDEVFHAVVAKHLMQHPLIPTLYDNAILPYDYTSWTGNHIWLHKQPLPLWAMAGSMWIFGVNEIALRLPSVLLTTLGIWLTFYIGSYLFDKRTGYIAAFLYSINGLIIEMTAGRVPTDHVDVFFLFFIELAVFFTVLFCQKKNILYSLLAGLSIGCAILCKWLPALIVLPIWLLLVYDSGKFNIKAICINFLVLLTVAVVVFLPWQLYIYHEFPIEAHIEAGYNLRHITEVLDKQGGPFYYYLDKIRINYGELMYVPLIWLLYVVYQNLKDLRRLALLTWIALPLIFFSALQTKMQGYVLFIAPAIFLIIADLYFACINYKAITKHQWLVNIILILLIALPVRYTIERVKPFSKMDRKPQWVQELKHLKHYDKAVLFNYERPIDAMFYTNMIVYKNIPDTSTISDLFRNGYTIIINSTSNSPKEIENIKGVIIYHLQPLAL